MIDLDDGLQRKVGKKAARFVSNAAENKRVKAVDFLPDAARKLLRCHCGNAHGL
jgi:hypothetical protein